MNAEWIITVFVSLDELLTKAGHQEHALTQARDAEVLLVGLVAAKYFQNHQERALLILRQQRYLSGPLSISRFNRRWHKLLPWVELALATLTEMGRRGEVFIVDSLPVPVCRRVRARRCRKVRGREYCGYCAAKKEKFFGWRLHLIVSAEGVPVSYEVLPGGFHDLTPVHELAYDLPPDAVLLGDKGYISAPDAETMLADTGVRTVTGRRSNMKPNSFPDDELLRKHRKSIETVNSQFEKMGLQRLHARTNSGFMGKVVATVLALTFSQLLF
jgi:hypothetical protein